jgi:thiol-disulfide isomerase/thioredoxin
MGKRMGISQYRNSSGPVQAVLRLAALVLIGLLAAQGCAPSPESASGGQVPLSTSGEKPPQFTTSGQLPPSPSGGQKEISGVIGVKVGNIPPDFALVDLDGNTVILSHLRGKTVVINFWTTWCPPCRAEMPALETLHQQYKDRDVVVLGVDLRESPDKVRPFVRKYGYSWIFVQDISGMVSRTYGIRAIPTTFFVGREGLIREVSIGAMSKDVMEAKLIAAMR